MLANYNATSKTLTGGIYAVTAPGVLRIDDGDVATLAADVRLSGAAAKIEDSSARNALRNLAGVTAAGALALDDAQALATTGAAGKRRLDHIGGASSLTTTAPTARAPARRTSRPATRP